MHRFHNIDFQVDLIQEYNNEVSWESYYADFLQHTFLPKVDALFNQWNQKHPNLNCTIEQINLETTLDSNSLNDLENDLLRQLQNQLENINIEFPEQSIDLKTKIIAAPTIFNAFLEYLKNGVFLNNIELSEFKQWLLSKSSFTLVEKNKIKECVLYNFDSLHRLSNMFYDVEYHKMIKIITTNDTLEMSEYFEKRFIEKLLLRIEKSLNLDKDNFVNKKTGIELLYLQTSIKNFAGTLLELLQKSMNIKELDIHQLQKLEISIVQAKIQFEMTNQILVDYTNFIELTPKKVSKDKLSQAELNAQQDNNSIIEKDKVVSAKSNSKLQESEDNDSVNEKYNSKNKIITPNKQKENALLTTDKAGLVLLHPFLSTLLKENKLLTESNSLSDPIKSALLFHYLATGNQNALDIELYFEKILLGIPISTIISSRLQKLSLEEMNSCDELLKATLIHWKVLNNSSPNTLRDMFIKRKGEITVNPKRIIIKIERLAQDILIDRLPWNISILKLPWLDKLIQTEW